MAVSADTMLRILIRKFQIPRFRVCRFQDTPGQIPDSVFPSFRGPPLGSKPKGAPPNSRFRVSEFPRSPLRSKAEGLPNPPKFQIPSFRVSEDPSWHLGRSKRDSQISRFRVSECNTYKGFLVRREQIPEYTAQFLFPLLYSCVARNADPAHGKLTRKLTRKLMGARGQAWLAWRAAEWAQRGAFDDVRSERSLFTLRFVFTHRAEPLCPGPTMRPP